MSCRKKIRPVFFPRLGEKAWNVHPPYAMIVSLPTSDGFLGHNTRRDGEMVMVWAGGWKGGNKGVCIYIYIYLLCIYISIYIFNSWWLWDEIWEFIYDSMMITTNYNDHNDINKNTSSDEHDIHIQFICWRCAIAPGCHPVSIFVWMSCQFGSHFKTCGSEDLIVALLPLVFSLTRSPIGWMYGIFTYIRFENEEYTEPCFFNNRWWKDDWIS